MHYSVMEWGRGIVDEWDLHWRPTVELGSYDVNGSLRCIFSGPYVGVDMRPGPGVDVVATAAEVPLRSEYFDVCVCTEMLEHDAFFWLSAVEMHRLLRPGGILLLSTRGFKFPQHDFPEDYWRFSSEALYKLFEWAQLQTLMVETDLGPGYPGVLATARKL